MALRVSERTIADRIQEVTGELQERQAMIRSVNTAREPALFQISGLRAEIAEGQQQLEDIRADLWADVPIPLGVVCAGLHYQARRDFLWCEEALRGVVTNEPLSLQRERLTWATRFLLDAARELEKIFERINR